jgi:hypothetical protein
MLRACVLKHGGSWDKSLPYVEFSYNNSYQGSLKMSPFEALYGRKCRTPLYWSETGERQLFVADIISEAEKQVLTIRENLRNAQSRQKSYADGKRRDVVFQEGDYVYLKVSPCVDSELKQSCHLGLLDLSRSLREWEKWLIDWSCQSS